MHQDNHNVPAEQIAPNHKEVQYIITKKSLEGIGGWLIFWIIILALYTIGYLTAFAALSSQVNDTPQEVINLVAMPIIALSSLASLVLIAMSKKLAIMATIITFSLIAILNSINTLFSDSTAVAMTVSVALSIMIAGLFSLYFIVSRRVKATLIK